MTTTTTATVEHIAPTALIIEENIRKDIDLNPEFIQTFRDHGVLLPVLVLRAPSGKLYVRDGQRRTLAAIEAGLDTIPAYVAATDDTARIRRLQQLVANEHRTNLNETDRAHAYAALALDGLTVKEIAKQAGTSTKRVKASITVAKSEVALTALDSMPISLDEALLFAEFEDDEDALNKLRETLKYHPAQIEHTAQRIRNDATRRRLVSEEITRLTVDGFTAVDGNDISDFTGLHTLTNAAADASEKPAITEDEHAECPGHTARVHAYGNDAATISWGCAQADEFHTRRPGFYHATTKASGPMTDEEKAERKRVIEFNKAWDASETVRFNWLKSLLSRKALPANAAQYSAFSVAVFYDQNDSKAITLAHKLLSVKLPQGYGASGLGDYLEAHPTKAAHVALAVALSMTEAHTSRMTWRSPGKDSRRYFQQLDSWGYQLSDVEKIVAGIETD